MLGQNYEDGVLGDVISNNLMTDEDVKRLWEYFEENKLEAKPSPELMNEFSIAVAKVV